MSVQIYICDQVRDIRALYGKLIESHPFHGLSILEFLQEQSSILWNAYIQKDPRIKPEISNHNPALAGKDLMAILRAQLDRSDIENVVLREYGFQHWDEIQPDAGFNIPFESAVNYLLDGQIGLLENLLLENPDLIMAHSDFGHKAAIIHYLGSNGVEMWRQVVPDNAVALLQFLIKNGARQNQTNKIYEGSDLISLVTSSAHPFDAGLGMDLLQALKNHEFN